MSAETLVERKKSAPGEDEEVWEKERADCKRNVFVEMSAKVHTSAVDEIAPAKMSSPPPEPKPAAAAGQAEAELVKCDCCGLTEECTPTYIAGIRGRYGGRWICGLCAEAVGDEIARSVRPITTEEALDRHMSFSRSFRPSSTRPPPNPKEHLISAMRQLLRRSLDRPRAARSTPSSPRKGDEEDDGGGGDNEKDDARGGLARSESCFSTIGG